MSRHLASALVLLLGATCSGGNSGVVVGFVINGQTGERMNMFEKSGNRNNLSDTPDSTSQVYTIINGEFVRAKPCGAGFINDKNQVQADGCYQFSNVPYGEQLPMFAVRDGFEKFHGVYEYPEGAPQVVGNIRIFPKSYTVDYKLFVHLDGRGVNGVTVACQIRQETVKLSTDGKFIPPANTTSQAISVTSGTDEIFGDGFARIGGAELVMGAKYHCEAYKADGLYEERGVLTGQADFLAGVDAPEVAVGLTAKAPDEDLLYAVYSSADDPETLLGSKAALVVTFNRPVEIVPGTADCQTARVLAPDTNGDGNVPPVEQNDVTGNGVSEQVNVTKVGDTGLKIAFVSPIGAFDPKDVGSMVEFHGIYVRPAASQVDGTILRVIGKQSNACSAGSVLASVPALKSARTGGDQTNELHLF